MSSSRHIPAKGPSSNAGAKGASGSAIDEDDLLDAAYGAILAVGWSRTTLTDVARRAGVSRMTLYRRWPDMQTLLSDLMTREWTATLGGSLDLDSISSSPDPLGRIASGVVSCVQVLRANPLLRRIIELDPELLLTYLLHRRGRSQDLLCGALAELIRRAQADGAVRAGDPLLLARTVLLTTHGFMFSAHTMIDTAPRTGADTGPASGAVIDMAGFDAELRHLVTGYLRP